MTDGRQTVEEGFLSSDILHDSVQPLKDKGIRVISLGIGKGTLLFDLLTLASTDEDVYSASDFKELKNLVTELTERNCPGMVSLSILATPFFKVKLFPSLMQLKGKRIQNNA